MTLAAGVAALAIGVSGAVATHVPQIDPLTVPVGVLATHNDVESFRISSLARAVQHHRADVFVQHVRLPAGGALPWHTHPGPVIVTVVRGSLGFQQELHHECVTTWYTAGHGFVEPVSQVVRAIADASGSGFDAYATFVTPSGTPNQTIPRDPPEACA